MSDIAKHVITHLSGEEIDDQPQAAHADRTENHAKEEVAAATEEIRASVFEHQDLDEPGHHDTEPDLVGDTSSHDGESDRMQGPPHEPALHPCEDRHGNGADADTIAEAYFTAVDATETAFLLQPKNIEGYLPAEAAILIEQALDPGGTVRNPVKSEHAGERWNLRQSAPLNQL